MQSAPPQDGTPVMFKGMIKPLVIMILAVAIVLGGIFGWQAFIASMIKKNMMAGASAPVTVSAVTATATKWQAQIGLNMTQIGSSLGSLLGGGYVNYFSMQTRSYKVIPQVERVSRLNASQLLDYPIANIGGVPVPLST
ncbi:MAG TPA: hypothetical protein VK251_03585, partial [Steroidobacteraceae bacterium]|nr:hypothetical protein [Steroidobacteraceae bacterium]